MAACRREILIMEKYRKIDLFTLELGYALCDEEYLESILKPIVEIRENIFEKHGVAIHHVRVKDNSNLLPFEYVIKVSDCEVARYTLKKDSILIIDTGSVTTTMKGSSTTEPAFGSPALWISSAKEDEAKANGYVIAPYSKIIKAHLEEIIRKNLPSVITTQYVSDLLDEVILDDNSALCETIAHKYGYDSYRVVKEILQSLLKEKISIRNIIPIFETIAAEEKIQRNGLPNLYEKVRLSIVPDIIAPLIENNFLKVLRLNQKLSEYLFDNENEIFNFCISDRELINSFSKEYVEISGKLDSTPIIICVSAIRHIVKKFINDICHIKNVTVISDIEAASAMEHFSNMRLEVISDLGECTVIPEKKISDQNHSEKTEEEKPAPTNEKDAYNILQKQLKTILNKLPEQEREVISMRFGLDGNGSHTLDEIGSYFNLTHKEIRGIESRTLQLLRKKM